ncbi:phosphoribosylanthranilate isomerase [Phaeobacter sp. B1627]|uniref:phosphoribosylanthranilate isomerase n=1 Tax=Phaeobacter sp. B1627 TaxID=2583809 RepID=UPI00111A38F5|nr:phosphoribosylanthranilate isomerase [Phaeobacter sp. B1627]TNJ39969.1 phosphoribosylanthranilate isomerase [Phaeobacter sp. B1627]
MVEIRSKICGLKTADDIAVAADAGAAYVGLNFFAKSPRSVSIAQAAVLAAGAPVGLAKVGLVVNAGDSELDAITGSVPLDMLQLHGGESPERVAEIKSRYGLPVMKVIGVAEADDLKPIDLYAQVADQIMIDAKAPKGAVLPGGNGITFDWQLLAAKKYWQVPWMLAGGLTPDNVAEAIRKTGARQVDVASGVESAPGQKDAALMRAFVAATQGL